MIPELLFPCTFTSCLEHSWMEKGDKDKERAVTSGSQGQQLCPVPSLWNWEILLCLQRAGNAARAVCCAPAGTRLSNAQIAALGQPEGSPGALWFQRNRSSSPSWTMNLCLSLFGTRDQPPWQRGFPWLPSRERSSCSTRKQEQGVPAFISNGWSEKRCEGAIWEWRNTELKPEQVKQAESPEPRALKREVPHN